MESAIFDVTRKSRTSPAAVGALCLFIGMAVALNAGAAAADPAAGTLESLQAEGIAVPAHGMLHNADADAADPYSVRAATAGSPGNYTLIFPSGKYLLVEVGSTAAADTVTRFARSENARIEPTPELSLARMDYPPMVDGWERDILDSAHARSQYHASGAGVSVAVMDSGIDVTHPALGPVDSCS